MNAMLRRALGAVLPLVVSAGAVLDPAVASASAGLSPGMTIVTGDSLCTLGFLAKNDAGDALAVTAGHCSAYVDQIVRTSGGEMIGKVVSRRDDQANGGWYGYTLIALFSNTYVSDRFFSGVRNAAKGDAIHKYGARTVVTSGKVVDVSYSGVCPECSILVSDIRVLPGDSGGPWYEAGGTLVGITIALDEDAQGAYLYAEAFPIEPLLSMIRSESPQWGHGIRVLVKS
ncbi:MAG: S1 family peptidase [Segniliparus sp.]|uniref:S1 family peptidase n=1 Tax=Segniliparus sp. TaxID=2804064 RepID=UPI003F4112D7